MFDLVTADWEYHKRILSDSVDDLFALDVVLIGDDVFGVFCHDFGDVVAFDLMCMKSFMLGNNTFRKFEVNPKV